MDHFTESYDHSSEGNTFRFQKEYKKSLIKFRRALSLSSDNTDCYYALGNVIYTIKEYKKAGTAFCIATRIRPNYLYAFIHWGNSLFLRCEYAGAIKIYKKVIELNPTDPLSYNNWACCLYSLKCYHEAITKFMEAISLDNQMNLAYFNLSLVLFHLKNPKEAIQVYRKGIEISEDGRYSINEIKDSYTLQLDHIKEELPKQVDPAQIEYLKEKLNAIDHVLTLLNEEGDIIEKPKMEEEYMETGEPQYGLSIIIENQVLLTYFRSMCEELSQTFLGIFKAEGSRIVSYNGDFLSVIIYNFCGFMSSNQFCESLSFATVSQKGIAENSEDSKPTLPSEILKKCEELAKFFGSTDRISEFIELLVKKMTLFRREEDKILTIGRNCLPVISSLSQNILKINSYRYIECVAEECMMDRVVSVLECFLDESIDLNLNESVEDLADKIFKNTEQNLRKLIQKHETFEETV